MWFFCNVDVHYLKTDHGGNFQLEDYDGQDCYLTVLYKKNPSLANPDTGEASQHINDYCPV